MLIDSIRCFINLVLLILVVSVGCCGAESWVMAKWVVDGDTIVLRDGRHVRYIGIDSPEIAHKKHRAEPMGDEAQSVNRELIDGWKLRLGHGREKTDR
jgi:micrococcal nuclease